MPQATDAAEIRRHLHQRQEERHYKTSTKLVESQLEFAAGTTAVASSVRSPMTNEIDPTEASRLLDSLRAEQARLLGEGRALAELIGMSQPHLDQILSGEKPVGARSLRKIAAYFARSHEGGAAVEPQPAAPTALSGMGGSTIRLVELGAVAQRQYIAARLEGSGVPKGIASYVALHVELDSTRSTAEGVRAAQAMAQAMLDEEAAEEAASASGD